MNSHNNRQGKPRRVNYRINYCSSEDPQYPVSQLVLQSADSKGWITKRFAPYPQTIVIQLLQLTVVQSLAFLSHQNKICTRIEIQGKEDQDQNWARLGYTTLQSGVTTNYQSRQLRNVNLGGRVLLLLKFTFHQNYTNHINIFNQVGLIALLVYGEKSTVQKELVKGKEGVVLANLSDLDKQTIMKLKNLQALKRQAIDQVRFDDAKRIKEDIDFLQNNLKALIILEKEKKQAIKREDYDQAKQLVQRMKKIRGPMVFARGQNQLLNNKSMDLNSYEKSPVRSRVINSSFEEFYPESENKGDFYKAPSRHSEARHQKKGFDLNHSHNRSTVNHFDEIKIHAKDRYPLQEQLQRDQQAPPLSMSRKKPLPPKYSNHNRSYRKPNLVSDEPDQMLIPSPRLPSIKKLQKLAFQQFDQCHLYFHIFNEITFEYIYSKDHTHREKGVSILSDIMREFQASNKKSSEQFVTASVFVVRQLIDDRILTVLLSIVDFFGMMMKKFRPKPISSANRNVKYIIQKLVQYLGHPNQRFRGQCQDVLAALPVHGLTSRQLCMQSILKNPKEKSPRLLVGKLNLLSRLIQKYKLSNDEELDELIDYGKKHLQDKNSDVRNAAVAFMASMSREMGYQNLYPDLESLKPQVIQMIEDRIKSQGGVIKKLQLSPIKPYKKNLPGSPSKSELPPPANPEYYCDFCKQFDKRFQNDDFRDQHLYSYCKMITLCSQCNQAIQVSSLNTHLLSQCPQHKYFKRCPKCKEAVPSKEYNNHTKMKQCITAKPPTMANRCPLCHQDIQPKGEGWVKHLVREKCPMNARQ